jgi:hypothetical protein
MSTEIQLIPWDSVAHDEGLGDQQLIRLIELGLFPKPITIPLSSRTSQRYFPSHELAARRACLLKNDGNKLAVKGLLDSLHQQRESRAQKALVSILDHAVEAL